MEPDLASHMLEEFCLMCYWNLLDLDGRVDHLLRLVHRDILTISNMKF